VNIAWETKKMDDNAYAMAFSEVVLPAIYDFDPQLLLISSGFDAAKGDLIGDCLLSPECFGLMTKSIVELVRNKNCGIVVR